MVSADEAPVCVMRNQRHIQPDNSVNVFILQLNDMLNFMQRSLRYVFFLVWWVCQRRYPIRSAAFKNGSVQNLKILKDIFAVNTVIYRKKNL